MGVYSVPLVSQAADHHCIAPTVEYTYNAPHSHYQPWALYIVKSIREWGYILPSYSRASAIPLLPSN